MKPYHKYLESLGHKLILNADGEVDNCRLDYDTDNVGHNGPECELCGESWCHHCENDNGKLCVKSLF